MQLTFWEGLQLLAPPEIERLERGAVDDGCEHKCRSIPNPSGIGSSDTPNMHHNSPSGSDVSEWQNLRSTFWSAVQPPMATCHKGRINHTEALGMQMLEG